MLPDCRLILLAALCVLPLVGCGSPQSANIELRKQNQALTTEVEQLRLQRKLDQATRVVSTGSPPAVELDRLFTVHGLKFGRLTSAKGSTLRVFVVPTDQSGDMIKAAGGFSVEAFDLSRGQKALVGSWTFTPEQAANSWTASALIYGYVLECPLPAPITTKSGVTLRVVFTDLLTHRTVEGNTTAKFIP